jgi:hypothetical protein
VEIELSEDKGDWAMKPRMPSLKSHILDSHQIDIEDGNEGEGSDDEELLRSKRIRRS